MKPVTTVEIVTLPRGAKHAIELHLDGEAVAGFTPAAAATLAANLLLAARQIDERDNAAHSLGMSNSVSAENPT